MNIYSRDYSKMTIEELEAEAENKDDAIAMDELVQRYVHGSKDTDADPEKAFCWSLKLADKDDAAAQFNLGLFYERGFGTECDLKKAVYWMKKADENGNEDAPRSVQYLEKAVSAMERAAEGDAQAQADYADYLMKRGRSDFYGVPGTGCEEAVGWAEKAAAQNNPDGLRILGFAYECGSGYKQDFQKAAEFYQRAADLGNPDAMLSLGLWCRDGEIDGKTEEEGFELIKRAAELGNVDAMKDLGQCYQFEMGTGYNMKAAVYWYTKYLKYTDDFELKSIVDILKKSPGMD